jgi:hypothetical protein
MPTRFKASTEIPAYLSHLYFERTIRKKNGLHVPRPALLTGNSLLYPLKEGCMEEQGSESQLQGLRERKGDLNRDYELEKQFQSKVEVKILTNLWFTANFFNI